MGYYTIGEVSNRTGLSIDEINDRIRRYKTLLKHRTKMEDDNFLLNEDGIKVLTMTQEEQIERFESRIKALENILDLKQEFIDSLVKNNAETEEKLRNKIYLMNLQIQHLNNMLNEQARKLEDNGSSILGGVSVSERAAFAYYGDITNSIN